MFPHACCQYHCVAVPTVSDLTNWNENRMKTKVVDKMSMWSVRNVSQPEDTEMQRCSENIIF